MVSNIITYLSWSKKGITLSIWYWECHPSETPVLSKHVIMMPLMLIEPGMTLTFCSRNSSNGLSVIYTPDVVTSICFIGSWFSSVSVILNIGIHYDHHMYQNKFKQFNLQLECTWHSFWSNVKSSYSILSTRHRLIGRIWYGWMEFNWCQCLILLVVTF